MKAARWKPPLITDTINRILTGQVSSWQMSCDGNMMSFPTSLHSPTAWSGTRVWTRNEHCWTLPLTPMMGIASQLFFYLSEKHLTIVSHRLAPMPSAQSLHWCTCVCVHPSWVLAIFLSRNPYDDGETETPSHQSLLQLPQAAPCLEGTHLSLSVSIVHVSRNLPSGTNLAPHIVSYGV